MPRFLAGLSSPAAGAFALPICVLLLLLLLPYFGAFVFLGCLVIVALLHVFFGPHVDPRGVPERLGLVGWIAVVCTIVVAVAFRVVWLNTVPAGYNCETLNWMVSAVGFLKNGFSYVPYDWYAHNLYAYLMALSASVVTDEITAIKLAGLVGGLVTIVLFFCWMRRFTGAVGAWSSTLLLAACSAHALMNRVGFHHFLMPLFFSVVFLGAWRTLYRRGPVGPIITALGVAGGLHAEWGFYFMPPVLLIWFGCLPIIDQRVFAEAKRRLWAAAGLSILLSLPLVLYFLTRLDSFNYLFSWLQPGATFHSTFGQKYAQNVEGLVWALSGRSDPGLRFEDVPYIAALPGFLFFIGVVDVLKGSRRDPLMSLVSLTLATGAAGMMLTKIGVFWFMGIIVPVFSCAGVGATSLIRYLEGGLSARFRFAPRTVLLALSLLQASETFRSYLETGVFAHLCAPSFSEDGFYPFARMMKDDAQRYQVQAPVGRRTRGLGDQFLRAGEMLPSYAFIKDVKPFKDIPFFPPAGKKQGIALYYPFGSFEQELLRPLLGALYPGGRFEEVSPPPPYDRRNPRPLFVRTILSAGQLAERAGLRIAGDQWQGVLLVDEDGLYRFVDGDAALRSEVWINGTRIALDKGEPRRAVPLEQGLHLISIAGGAPPELRKMQKNAPAKTVPASTFNVPPGFDLARLSVFVRPLAQEASSYYVMQGAVDTSPFPSLVWDLLASPTGGAIAWGTTKLVWFDENGTVSKEQPSEIPPTFVVTLVDGRVTAFAPSGEAFEVADDGKLRPAFSLGCQPLAADAVAGRTVVLCHDDQGHAIKVLRARGQQQETVRLELAHGALPPNYYSIRALGREFIVADRELSLLMRVSESGQVLRSRTVPEPFIGFGEYDRLTLGGDGLCHISTYEGNVRSYTADGRLLVNAQTCDTNLFFDETGAPMNTHSCHLRVGENGALAVCQDGRLMRFKKMPFLPVPSPPMTNALMPSLRRARPPRG